MKKAIVILLCLGMLAWSLTAFAEEYQPPSLDGFTKHENVSIVDKNGDDFKEVIIDRWFSGAPGTNGYGLVGIFSYTSVHDGKTYMWVRREVRSVKDVKKMNYVWGIDTSYAIIDTDCDGTFDTKVALSRKPIKFPKCYFK